RPHSPFPPAGLVAQPLAARRREAVVPRAAVILGCAPERSDPPAILETVERRIQRPVLDLQHLVGSLLDGVRDRVPVRGAEGQGFQDQQVERPLEHFALNRLISAFRHSVASYSTRSSTGSLGREPLGNSFPYR